MAGIRRPRCRFVAPTSFAAARHCLGTVARADDEFTENIVSETADHLEDLRMTNNRRDQPDEKR